MDNAEDYYEILQISPNAEPETVHRVYRLLAQRFHPDNRESGSETRFRAIAEAYRILSDPEARARYDVVHSALRQQRWRVASNYAEVETDFESEQRVRLSLLELLYTRRRTEFETPGLSLLDIEALIGCPREHLEFSVWYLTQKKFVTRNDGSILTITVDGIDYVEQHLQDALHRRRLGPGRTVVPA